MIEGVSQGVQASGGVHHGAFNNLPVPGANTRPLVEQFDAVWSHPRYLKNVAPKNRMTCPNFSNEMNRILADVPDIELPHGVVRHPSSRHIGSSDIIAHAGEIRNILTRLREQ